MNQSTQGQNKVWVWFLIQEKLEKQRRIDAANAPRGPVNKVEERAAECLLIVDDAQAWNLKDKFKGSTLAVYWKGMKKLTPQGWRTAVGIMWPDYQKLVGDKPK